MLMNFETIRNAIITILGAAEAGRYQTIGFQRQSTSAEEINNLPMVQVYYKSGDFPKSSGAHRGPTQHDITFNIELLVSEPAKLDLSIINHPDADINDKRIAMAALQESSYNADRAMDALITIVYQVLMDARNIDLGLTKGVVANRWVDNPEKDNPLEKGSLIVLSGSMRYMCRTQEEVLGYVGVIPDPIIYSSEIEINEDPVQKTAVEIQNS